MCALGSDSKPVLIGSRGLRGYGSHSRSNALPICLAVESYPDRENTHRIPHGHGFACDRRAVR